MKPGSRKQLSVLIPLELYQALQELAQESGRTLAPYVRQVLKQYVRHVEEEGKRGWWTIRY